MHNWMEVSDIEEYLVVTHRGYRNTQPVGRSALSGVIPEVSPGVCCSSAYRLRGT